MRIHQSNTVQLYANSQGTSTPTANVVTKNSKNGNNGKYKGKNTFGNKPRVVCQLCGKNNHVATKCYKRFDVSFSGLEPGPSNSAPQSQVQAHLVQQNYHNYSPNPYSPNSYSSNDTHTPHHVTNNVGQVSYPNGDWFVDSGASHHVTSQLQNLNLQSTPYNGMSDLIVGNGSSASIKQTGTMSLPSL